MRPSRFRSMLATAFVASLSLLSVGPAAVASASGSDLTGDATAVDDGPDQAVVDEILADVRASRSVAQSEDAALLREIAATYQDLDSVSATEGLRRARLVEEASLLQQRLAGAFPDEFGGLYFDHDRGAIVVGWVGAQGQLPEALAGHGYIVTAVTHSEMELERATAAVAEQLQADGVAGDVMADIRLNEVTVTVTPGFTAAAQDAIARSTEDATFTGLSAAGDLNASTPIRVLVEPALAAPAATVHGGMAGSSCTWGLSGRNSSGNPVMITAGHCSNTQTIVGTATTFVHAREYGSYDLQIHTVSTAHTVKPWIYDGIAGDSTPYYRVVTGTRTRAALVVGEVMCKRGKTTGYTCGTVHSKIFSPSYIANANATFIVVTSSTTDQAEPGDSGGSVFTGSLAAGIVSGHFPANRNMIFMAANYISAAGWSVMTG